MLLRLFKVVFGSVTLFQKNERMLRPHLQTIVLSCLRYTTRVKDPTNYYFLLRALFRSISGGKFETSYKVGRREGNLSCRMYIRFAFERRALNFLFLFFHVFMIYIFFSANDFHLFFSIENSRILSFTTYEFSVIFLP